MPMRYEFDNRPETGRTMPISDDIRWLRMPLPIKLNHINLWIIEDGDNYTLVDTGMHTPDAREAWDGVFDEIIGDAPISRVIVTHLHPDHVGNAGWLTRRAECDLWMTREEYMLCRVLVADTGKPAPDEALHFYRTAGFNDDELDRYQKAFGMFGRAVAKLPEAYHRIKDEDRIRVGEREWRVIIGRGHSPEHACLYDEADNLLIAGDQILPTISSNVSVYPTEPDANPLKAWLDSLAHLKRELDEDVLVLPAHGKPFRGAHERLDALTAEHLEGLDKLLAYCSEPRMAVDVFPALFRTDVRRQDMLMFATGEAIAHLHYLMDEGQIERFEEDGRYFYRRLTS